MKSSEPQLNINGTAYSFDELKSGSFKPSVNSFEQTTLNFCHDWLNQKPEFKLQTSGSTGPPKIITITRQQMETSANLTIKALRLKPSYTALVCLDTKYIAGQMMLVRSLVLGMDIIAVDPSANPFDKIPSGQSLDFAALVPYQVQAILNSEAKARLNKLKCAIIGGASLDLTLKKELASLECEFYATYGMTETISHVALQKLNGMDSQEYFEAFRGIKLRKDERGCLIVQSNFLGNDEIMTNDLVDMIGENKFLWLGRWDNIINSGGVKVSPEKIEHVIQQIFYSLKIISRFFVTGFPDKLLGKKVVLIVESHHFPEELKSKLEKELDLNFERFERPKEVKFIEHFKQSETGKVLRAETLRLIPASAQA